MEKRRQPKVREQASRFLSCFLKKWRMRKLWVSKKSIMSRISQMTSKPISPKVKLTECRQKESTIFLLKKLRTQIREKTPSNPTSEQHQPMAAATTPAVKEITRRRSRKKCLSGDNKCKKWRCLKMILQTNELNLLFDSFYIWFISIN